MLLVSEIRTQPALFVVRGWTSINNGIINKV